MYYVGESRVDHILYIVVPFPSAVLSTGVGSAVVSTLLSTKPIYRLFCSFPTPLRIGFDYVVVYLSMTRLNGHFSVTTLDLVI